MKFREARYSDLDLLFRWRNDPVTRENSINTDEITREDHEKWLTASLQDPDRKLYVAEHENTSIGTVRFDYHLGQWELSWTVAPECRGKGMGKMMVKSASEMFGKSLIARIKTSNLASIQIMRHVGFELVSEDEKLMVWRLLR